MTPEEEDQQLAHIVMWCGFESSAVAAIAEFRKKVARDAERMTREGLRRVDLTAEQRSEQHRIAMSVTPEYARTWMLEVASCDELLDPVDGLCDCARAHFKEIRDAREAGYRG